MDQQNQQAIPITSFFSDNETESQGGNVSKD